LTSQATLDFISRHKGDDVRKLALQGTKDAAVDLSFALQQIAGWQKARQKLPSWASIEGIVYPPHISMEQCSSEQTARYKASIAGEGQLVVDLTAGLGVDLSFISQGFHHAVHVEQNEQLCAISSNNYKQLGLNQIEVLCGDGTAYLHTMPHADLLFIDPARRDEHGARTYGIADCTPNVLELCDEMLQKADRVMIKLSPMLDWRKAVKDLGKVREVHIVSVDNECKELLLVLSAEETTLQMFCVNNENIFHYCEEMQVSSADETFQTSASLATSESSFNDVLQEGSFLYEPNASIMKAGCFRLLENQFGLRQLDKNSHLFASDREIKDFPGRRFIIDRTTSMNKRELKTALAGITSANISVRNFPLSVAELRKRLKFKEGGQQYIFATSVAGRGHTLIICHKSV